MSDVKKKSAANKTVTVKEQKDSSISPVIEVEALEECPFNENEGADKVQEISSEIPKVEIVVSKEIAKYDKVIPAIAELKKEYMGLTIAGIDDEDGYKAVSKGLRFVTSKGTAVEAVRKQLKKPYLDIGTAIDKRAAEIVAMIAPIKTYLKDTKQVVDDARVKRETELEEQRQRILKYRNDMLIQAGMSLIGNTYIWKDPFDTNVEETLLYVNIETMDDTDFNEEVKKIVDLQSAATQRRNDEQAKLEKEKEENRKKEEAVKLERENMRNEKIQMRLDFLKDLGCSVSMYREKRGFGVVEENAVYYEFKNKGFSISTKDALADVENWSNLMQETKTKIAEINNAVSEEEAQAKANKEKEEELTKNQNAKVEALRLIGLSYSELTGFMFYKNESLISYPELRNIEESVWNEKVNSLKKRMLEIDEELKLKAIQDNQRLVDEAKKQLEAEKKKKDDEALKLAAAEEERVANLNDKQKLSEYVTKLLEIKAPEYKTAKYKALHSNIEKVLIGYK